MAQILTLENDYLNVNINPVGAELCGLLDKRDGIQHMWSADAAFWPRHAPILFPTVGESKDGIITVNNNEFPMGRHGFVRGEAFTVVAQTSTELELELRSNERTRQHYPFEFVFRVGYDLKGQGLAQSFEVESTDERVIGFQLGGHPAFAVPFRNDECYDDYQICFDQPQTIDRHLLSVDGLYSGATRRFMTDQSSFGLYYDLFQEDALVFKQIPSKSVWIQKKEGGKRLQMDYTGFPNLGIWSKPGADYVCIEPWIGCADSIDQRVDFFQKDSIVRLEPQGTFKAEFLVSLIH